MLCSLLLLVLASVIAALGLLQTGNGQAFLEKKLNELVAASGVSIHGLRGSIPLDFSLALSFADSRGTWLEIKNASLGLDFSDFPALLHVDLGVEEGLLARLPDSSPAHAQQTTPLDVRDLLKTISGATSGFPSWIPGIEIRSLAIDHLRVQRSLYDQAYARESESLQAQKEAAINVEETVTLIIDIADRMRQLLAAESEMTKNLQSTTNVIKENLSQSKQTLIEIKDAFNVSVS